MRKPVERDMERFKHLSNENTPVMPEGFSVPLEVTTTRELISKRWRKLSPTQISVLRSMLHYGHWNPQASWTWGGVGNTKRSLDSLVKRGFVSKPVDDGYTLTAEGDRVARLLGEAPTYEV